MAKIILHKASISLMLLMICLGSCSGKKDDATSETMKNEDVLHIGTFNADTAFQYVKTQTDFGPRVPNTNAHAQCAVWLYDMLQSRGADVEVQQATLTAFDGTPLKAKNIYARFMPGKEQRVLLLAHWDTRPWADSDADESKHKSPSDGANDGASGVAVLLEVARQLQLASPKIGVDILFVDAEDWGSHSDDESWALGARYFVANPPASYVVPREVILLDMVGGRNARFAREYFSENYASATLSRVWEAASKAGVGQYFPNMRGGAITDDHLEFIKVGVPAIDIIEYNPQSATGFNPVWHTSDDNISNIDSATLRAVGQTLMQYIYGQ